jgi:hypothetical protein
MCPGCVLAEVEGQDTTIHGAGVQGMDGSDSNDDGEMDGGFESAEMFVQAAFIAHGVQHIPGHWGLRHLVARLITAVSRCRRH